MKSLAYFHISQKWLNGGDTGEIHEVLIDGGNPFVYWKAKAARDKKVHISGITRGDETQALITCSDRLSRCSHKIIELGYPSSYAREITFDDALSDQFTEWAIQYKKAMTTSQFHNLIVVEKGVIPREVELALPEALDTGKARDFPEVLRIEDVHDFDFHYAPEPGQIGWVVTTRERSALPESMRGGKLLSAPDATKRVKDHLGDLYSEAEDISLKIPRRNHIRAAIKKYSELCQTLANRTSEGRATGRGTQVRLIPANAALPLRKEE